MIFQNGRSSYPVFKIYKVDRDAGDATWNRTESQCFYEILESVGDDIRIDLDWRGELYTNGTFRTYVAHPRFQAKFWSGK